MRNDDKIEEQLLNLHGGVAKNSLSSILNSTNEENEMSIVNHSAYHSIENVHSAIGNNQNEFKLLSLNAQSIYAKFSGIETLLHNLHDKNAEPDIICIQESWLHDQSDLSLIQLDDYNCISQGHRCTRHGGLITYVKKKYAYKKIEYGRESNVWEGLFVEVSSDDFTNNIIIGNIYKPPKNNNNNNNVQQFINEITPILQKYDSQNNDILLAGDFNINLLKIEEREIYATFLDLMMSHSFFPKITLPTRFSMHSCSLLDNVFCKLSSNTISASSGIIYTGISDHLPYFVCIKKMCYTKSGKTKLVPKKYNCGKKRQAFLNDLLTQDVYQKLDKNVNCDPNKNYSILSKILEDAQERHFPKTMVKYNKHRHKDSKWITYGIINSIAFRDKLHLRLKRTPIENTEYETIKHNLCVYNAILKKMIREAKEKYYHATFEKHKFDMKNTWKEINHILARSRNESKTIDKIVVNGRKITDQQEIANEFNNFFVNIGPKLASCIDTENKKPFSSYLHRTVSSNFHFSTVTVEDITKILHSLQSKTSFGHDNISTKFLKVIAPALLSSLTLIINQSLMTGIFPSALKIAKVVPLHKKDSTVSMDNYRPVSLLTSISKVFEKVVHIQVSDYFVKNELFFKSQYGFRAEHSTELAGIELVDRIHTEMDNKKNPFTIYMDLSKAFDTLDHSILLRKLQHYGINDLELSWFRSYLTDRTQYVEINQAKSSMASIETGVPQGSILGPLLFLIYMNDIPSTSDFFKFILYADDTSLFNSINISLKLNVIKPNLDIINREIDKIYDWLAVNMLSLNVKKTKYMIFHHRNAKLPSNISLKINSIEIERVDNFNFLGLTINEHMSWKPHIDKIANKISKFNGILNKLKHILPANILKTLYFSLIQSQLNYGILIWGFDLNRLEKLQKKAIRIISCSKYNAHTEPLFKKYGILKVSDMFDLNALKFYYRYVNKKLPSFFENYVDLERRHSHDTRFNHLIPHNVTRTYTAQKCLRNYIPSVVNACDSSIITKVNSHSFKGFSNYAKWFLIKKYSEHCVIQDCYICNRNS